MATSTIKCQGRMPILKWGTTLTAKTDEGHILLAINHNYLVSVWLVATNTIYVLVIANTGNIFYKYADDTISFGDTASESHVTITRSGRSITVTTDFYSTITSFGYPT